MNSKTIYLLNILFIVVLFFSTSFSRTNEEVGQPFIKYYSPENYQASLQNWCVIQDKSGIMHFGNNNGIMEFDGISWRSIKTPNNSVVRSLSMDSNGRIYAAASSDFGYLAPDSSGQLQFVSLLNLLEEKERDFGDVWDVVASSHGIYYKTKDKIFRWNGKNIAGKQNPVSGIKIYENVNAYRLYKIKDDVYVRSAGKGLLKILENSLELIPDGQKFASIGVYDMLPFGNKILVTTNKNGLFLYDGKHFSKFKTEADSFIKTNRLYNACILNNGNIAFCTQRGGAGIIDNKGKLIRIFNTANGLSTDIVNDIFQDNQGGLWLAMNEGIDRIEISSPFRIIPETNSGNTFVFNLYRFHNNLYSNNYLGAAYFDESSSKFKIINGINSSGGNFVSAEGSLFGAFTNGVLKIKNRKVVRSYLNYSSNSLFNSVIDSTIIYLVNRNGIAILKVKNSGLKVIKEISEVGTEISSVLEDKDTTLWIKTMYEGIIHIKSLGNLFSPKDSVTYKYYNQKNGLPSKDCQIFSIQNKILFAADSGLFRFDKKTKSFIRDSILGKSFAGGSNVISLMEEDKDGDLWILAQNKNGSELGKAVKQKNGNYFWKPNPKFKRLDLNKVFTIYPDYDRTFNKEFLWISTRNGLINYDPGYKQVFNSKFKTFIRSAVLVKSDSLIYGGATPQSKNNKHIFPFKYNDLLFQFSAAFYDKPEANQFQYYLEGNDENWSGWSLKTKKEYSNLPGGDYKFHVRSKNIYGTIGSEDVFSFSIQSPWYFSWWTYLLYAGTLLFLLYLIRNFELKRIKRKHELQLQSVEFKKLKEMDQMKSQFFANISHEFRTPLTLILGQVESVLSSNIETKIKGKLHVANRNARRLLTLINQLLDLSKLEAGSMELKGEQHNIVSFLKSLFYSFESLAESEKIILRFESEYENIPVVYDPDKMEKIFYNLISNALKFTSANGEIKVSLTIHSSNVIIIIKDTGKGISKEHLPNIFNRFYQVDESSTREYEGTGIGLALTKELIELHNGKIKVKSEEGFGTEFIINLPLGNLKDKKEQLVKFPEETESSIERHESSIEHQASSIEYQESSNEIVLIVEDNQDVRNYIREQIEIDYKIIEAQNGEEGILKAQQNIPDLIITDVMMPKMNGYQFSKKIRSDVKTSHIPIIMLTAKAGLDDKIEGLETGIDAYLTKPFSSKELIVRIKNLIIQRKDLRKKFSSATLIKPSEVSAVSADQKFLEKTIKIIETHFEDEKFSVEKLAEEVSMSVSQLNRKLNALIDQPAGKLIRSLRLQRAADLLKQNACSVAEICYKLGFNDQAYFSRTFKKQFGASPSEYKKERSK